MWCAPIVKNKISVHLTVDRGRSPWSLDAWIWPESIHPNKFLASFERLSTTEIRYLSSSGDSTWTSSTLFFRTSWLHWIFKTEAGADTWIFGFFFSIFIKGMLINLSFKDASGRSGYVWTQEFLVTCLKIDNLLLFGSNLMIIFANYLVLVTKIVYNFRLYTTWLDASIISTPEVHSVSLTLNDESWEKSKTRDRPRARFLENIQSAALHQFVYVSVLWIFWHICHRIGICHFKLIS